MRSRSRLTQRLCFSMLNFCNSCTILGYLVLSLVLWFLSLGPGFRTCFLRSYFKDAFREINFFVHNLGWCTSIDVLAGSETAIQHLPLVEKVFTFPKLRNQFFYFHLFIDRWSFNNQAFHWRVSFRFSCVFSEMWRELQTRVIVFYPCRYIDRKSVVSASHVVDNMTNLNISISSFFITLASLSTLNEWLARALLRLILFVDWLWLRL